MILVTVGSQLPFDRLTRAVDAWCQTRPDWDVFGQIAEPGQSGYAPEHFHWVPFLAPTEFDKRFEAATLIVAHAGMGSIIAALMAPKPIVIMPRRASLGEHRNDHQYATAERFQQHPGVYVARTEQDLPLAIDAALSKPVDDSPALQPYADDSLIQALRRFITHGKRG